MNKQSIAVIGAGISGLTIARLLQDQFNVCIYEREAHPGGLIKCKRVEGNLYHMVGGHVFNSKRKDVLDFFWNIFNREQEFTLATRNAAIHLDRPIGYPIENHLYDLGSETAAQVVEELLELHRSQPAEPLNFADFLKQRFGHTLYELYFKPYNEKIWQQDLHEVAIGWLEGKLPMPTVAEILTSNINRAVENAMVHSTFYYPKVNGSQYLVDRLSEGLDIRCGTTIHHITRSESTRHWTINDEGSFEHVIYAGNIKQLPSILRGFNCLNVFHDSIRDLSYHGTTTALCEIDANPYSWIYLPDPELKAHRMINTGNFSNTNNRTGAMTATIEFTNRVGKEEILEALARIPFNPRYLDHQFTEYTYPIQKEGTRALIRNIKESLQPEGLHLLGRFAEWEYYNMDAAIGAAIDLAKQIRRPLS